MFCFSLLVLITDVSQQYCENIRSLKTLFGPCHVQILRINNGFYRYDNNDWLIVLGFNDMSTLVGHFVLSPREREKRDSRGDETSWQEVRNANHSTTCMDASLWIYDFGWFSVNGPVITVKIMSSWYYGYMKTYRQYFVIIFYLGSDWEWFVSEISHTTS